MVARPLTGKVNEERGDLLAAPISRRAGLLSRSLADRTGEMDDTPEGRRKYPRIPSKNSVLVRVLGDKEREGFAKTEIVGLGGCMFASNEALGEGSYLDLLIAVHHTVVKAFAKVAYEKPRDEGRWNIGVEFLQINEEDRKLLETLWLEP